MILSDNVRHLKRELFNSTTNSFLYIFLQRPNSHEKNTPYKDITNSNQYSPNSTEVNAVLGYLGAWSILVIFIA